MNNPTVQELIRLEGRRAIVTGGAVGIGYAIAARLAEAGARVLIANLAEEKSRAAAETLRERGGEATWIVADVSDEAQVEAMVARAVEEFGGVDILVNNAGIYPEKPVLESSRADFEKIIHVNLMGAFFAAKHAALQMIRQGEGGRIVNITSIDAIHPSEVGLAFYDASKHGLWGFTKNLALELAPHKIWVNAIAPGGVATPGTHDFKGRTPEEDAWFQQFIDRVPMKRPADVDEIGRVALFLCSDLASYMTGSQIVVDGGRLLN